MSTRCPVIISSCLRTLIGLVVLGLGVVSAAGGQVPDTTPDSSAAWHEDAWTPIVTQNGVSITYIYYPQADNEHDGIVLRLRNETEVPVRYAFTLVFRAPDAETTAVVQGRLQPGQTKTGDKAGLFWMPFKGQDRSIGEIGLRGLKIVPRRESPSDRSSST